MSALAGAVLAGVAWSLAAIDANTGQRAVLHPGGPLWAGVLSSFSLLLIWGVIALTRATMHVATRRVYAVSVWVVAHALAAARVSCKPLAVAGAALACSWLLVLAMLGPNIYERSRREWVTWAIAAVAALATSSTVAYEAVYQNDSIETIPPVIDVALISIISSELLQTAFDVYTFSTVFIYVSVLSLAAAAANVRVRAFDYGSYAIIAGVALYLLLLSKTILPVRHRTVRGHVVATSSACPLVIWRALSPDWPIAVPLATGALALIVVGNALSIPVELVVPDNEMMSPCPSLISSYYCIGGSVVAVAILMYPSPWYAVVLGVLTITSICNHTRPYGSYKYDTIDMLDRIAVAASMAVTCYYFFRIENVIYQAVCCGFAAASMTTYLLGTTFNVLAKRSFIAAYWQALMHGLSATTFVLVSAAHRLRL